MVQLTRARELAREVLTCSEVGSQIDSWKPTAMCNPALQYRLLATAAYIDEVHSKALISRQLRYNLKVHLALM